MPHLIACSDPRSEFSLHLRKRADLEVVNIEASLIWGHVWKPRVTDCEWSVNIPAYVVSRQLDAGEYPVHTEANLTTGRRELERATDGYKTHELPIEFNNGNGLSQEMIFNRGRITDMLLAGLGKSPAAAVA